MCVHKNIVPVRSNRKTEQKEFVLTNVDDVSLRVKKQVSVVPVFNLKQIRHKRIGRMALDEILLHKKQRHKNEHMCERPDCHQDKIDMYGCIHPPHTQNLRALTNAFTP